MRSRTPAIDGLYAITPDCADTAELVRRCGLALSGGARVLQYRSKTADASLRLAQARALRRLTHQAGATLIVNDDVQLALEVDADGAHLGATDGDLAAGRAMLGPGKRLGASCYNRASLAREAVAAGADYVAFGAFFPSSVKPHAVRADATLLHDAKVTLGVPVVAIGGITAGNGRALIDAGADALAVISAVFGADDIEASAREFSELFKQSTT